MIIFKISEDVERNIEIINTNGRIVGDWTAVSLLIKRT